MPGEGPGSQPPGLSHPDAPGRLGLGDSLQPLGPTGVYGERLLETGRKATQPERDAAWRARALCAACGLRAETSVEDRPGPPTESEGLCPRPESQQPRGTLSESGVAVGLRAFYTRHSQRC